MATEVLPPSLQSYKPSPNEHEAVKFLFKQADTDSLGVLTGDKAVPFFGHAGLPPTILGQIWQEADPENSGFLSQERFGVACRLIGHAQVRGASAEVKPEWVYTAGPLPKFEGFAIPVHLLPPSTPSSPAPAASPSIPAPSAAALPIQAQSTGSTAGVSITPEEKARYAKLFNGSGPVAGLLDGDKARDIFIKSQLPFDTLGKIWNLADTHSRGSLDVADFTIGMHLIQHTMNGTLSTLPNVLQPALYASAASLPLASSAGSAPRNVPGSPLRQSSVPVAPIQQQITGQPGFTGRSTFMPQMQQGAAAWDITAQEKSDADGYFDGIDAERKGFIEGEAAVQFFSQSGLPIDVLARVWDLADIRQSGGLNKDEFAVALRLLRDKLAGKELPMSLPVGLIPPSLRAGGAPLQPAAPQKDLLDLDDDDDEPAVAPSSPPQLAPTVSSVFANPPGPSTIFPQATGGSVNRGGLSPQSTGYGGSALQGTIFPQGIGNSAGGRTLSPQSTGFGNNFGPSPVSRSIIPPQQQAPAATSATFFDDNDDADQTAKLSADSAQLGQLKNEHESVSKSVDKLAMSRSELESSISTTTSAINELQIKLSQARAAHETERKLVDDLQIRQKDQAALLTRARTELITAESDLSALRVERTEIEGNFLRDKEEVRDMKKKMAEVSKETSELKDILEKLKKEARQTKGLVAISKKQLATAEGDKEKVSSEIEAEKHIATREVEPVAAEEPSPFDHSFQPPVSAAHAASHALPTSPAVTSPAASVRSTNPFERMGAISTAVSPQATGSVASPSSIASPSMPIVAAAAVGAGVVATASAIGAGVAGVLGLNDEKKEESTGEGAPAPAAASEEAAPSMTQETTDPFGVPIAPSTETHQPSAQASFDDAFGDDFATSAAPPSSSAVPSSFDGAFADMNEPSSTSIAAPVAVTEIASPPVATLDDESTALPSHPSDMPQEIPQEIEEPDSSDDENVIEEATPSGHSSSRDISETTSTPVATSTSDSGESFVHVPSATIVESEAESRFPSLEPPTVPSVQEDATPLHAPAVTALQLGDRSASPASEMDTFEDAQASGGVFDDPPTSTSPTADKPIVTRRAAPPPPSRSSVPAVAAVEAPPSSAFDDAFGSSFVAPSTSNVISKGTDDFDDAFSDLPPPAAITSAGGASADSTFASDLDSFDADEDFAFKPTFDAPSSPVGTSASAAFDDSFANFDSSFEPAHSAKSSISPSGTAALHDSPQHGFSFDDAFGASSANNLAASLGKPVSSKDAPPYAPAIPARGASTAESLAATPAAAPAPTPALEDDHAGVKQIVGMGFSRTQAIDALEKYNYDVGRAINFLLG